MCGRAIAPPSGELQDAFERDVEAELAELLDDHLAAPEPGGRESQELRVDRRIVRVDPVPQDVEARALVLGRELDARHELEPELARRRRRLVEPVERVVIGQGDAREVLRAREQHHLRRGERPVGAVRMAVEVVSGHRRKAVRQRPGPSTSAGRSGARTTRSRRSPRPCGSRRAPSRSRPRRGGSPSTPRRRPRPRRRDPTRPAGRRGPPAAPKRDRLHHVGPSPHAAVHQDRDPPADRLDHLGQRVQRRRARIELPSTVVRHHDRLDAVLDRERRVLGGEDPLHQDREPGRVLADEREVLPRHVRLVEVVGARRHGRTAS